jgi:mannose-6-phosphate isomerase-like protein (cupin superfamily)
MKQVFQPLGYFTIPDGTNVSPFLNGTDVQQLGVPWDALGDMSIASGRVPPSLHSGIHVHPVVTQVTYLLAGTLTVRMKDAFHAEPYDLRLEPGQAVVTQPGTLFQLRNDDNAVAEVLYIASPAFVFETDGGRVRYCDAPLVARTWDELSATSDDIPAMRATPYEARASREESMRRLAAQKGRLPAPLTEQRVVPLKSRYDYLAPDGSEIRLLVTGMHGGLAHCVLPAGRTSSPVRHRTVEELWYVLEGGGEVWRQRAGEPPRIDAVCAGDSLRIPVDTQFQFRAVATDLKLLLATMPPWPGAHEAVAGTGGFAAAVGPGHAT